METWTARVHEHCGRRGMLDDKKWETKARWFDQIRALDKVFKTLRTLKDGDRPNYPADFVESVLPLAVSTKFLDAVRELRNLSSHTVDKRYMPSKDDAKLTLDFAFSILERSLHTPLLDETQETD